MSDIAKLSIGDKTYEFPVVVGTENEHAIDISKLRAESGLITLDVGFKNTGSTKSEITFLDGEKGILRYRGYSIEDLAEKSNFLEVAHLLIYGELPSQEEFSNFKDDINSHTLIHEDLKRFYEAYPSKAHPMGILASMVSAMSTFYTCSHDPNSSQESINRTIIRLLAKIPTISAWAYKNSVGHPVIYPKNSLSYAANFVNMMFALPTEDYEINPVVVDALDKLLILHADHEQNCSAAAVRIAGSSRCNLYSAISTGITALWGPLHGGANQAVIEMLDAIHADGGGPNGVTVGGAKDKTFLAMADFFTGNLVRYQGDKFRPIAKNLIRGGDAIEFGKGVVYVSSWTQGKVIAYNIKEKKATTVIEGLTSAADFYYDRKANQLVIPDMLEGKLHFVNLK
jgi:citrate synthase